MCLNALLPAGLLLALALRRWVQLGDAPTGIDPGNWFAFGEGLFGGVGKSTAGAYPPLVPAMMHVGQLFAAPFVVAKAVAVGSQIAVGVAAYLVTRKSLGPWFGLSAAALIATANPVSEAVAFGGYPQNYAFAFLITATWQAAEYLRGGGRRFELGTAIALIFAALTHHVYFLLATVSVAAVWAVWLSTRPRRRELIRQTSGLLTAGGLGLLAFLPTLVAIRGAGYDAPLNASGTDLAAAIRYQLGDMPWLWTGIAVGAATFLVLSFPRRGDPRWQLAAALAGPSLVAFIATNEPRLMSLLMAGATFAIAFALRDLSAQAGNSIWGAAALAAPAAVAVGIVPILDATAFEYHAYYRVADDDVLQAASWIDAHDNGGRAVVSSGGGGWPIGWWFEGLTDVRIVVGSKLDWLAFPEERENARLAARFFDPALEPQRVPTLASEHGIDFVVVQRTQWLGWQRWLAEPQAQVSVAYENPTFVILEFGE